ncbi:MAG TPA: flagellar filament capping protein FliD [Trinickia sp.]
MSTTTSSLLQQAAQSILSGATKSTLDVNSLVSALVTAKTAAQAQTIATQQSSDNTTLSAIGQMKSALTALQTSLSGLSDGSLFTQLGATMSGTGITATTSTGAAAGSYSVSVQQIATANQISSGAYASGATLGTGTVTIGVGTGSMNVTLDSTNNTLAGLASAINASTSNPGVTASVVTASDGQHLVLTSTQTGAANTVTVSAGAGVDTGLNTASFTQVTAGQDANLTISGNAVTSASNNVTGALTGVTLSLTSASVGTTQTLSVATDTTAISKAVQGFATAYNQWISTEKSLSSYDASTSTAGPLLGDAMLNTAVNGIASIMASGVTVGGTTYSLAQLGVDLNNDGTVTFTSSTLDATMASSPTMVQNVFNGTNGIGEQLNAFIDSYTKSSIGQIDQRSATINADLTSLTQQQSTLATYQQTLTDQYNAQFTALNNLMTQMQSNTTYLNQLFGGNGSAGTLNKQV